MQPLVSILVPAYNAEKTIRETLLSAVNQTWKNKEVIVVDDGSLDLTFNVAKGLESRFVKVVKQENTGASGARNLALRLAQGAYIQWLDADDLLAQDKLTLQLQGADDGMTSRTLISSAFGTFFATPTKAQFIPHALWQNMKPVEFLLTIFEQNLFMIPAVWLVSRRLTELAGPWDQRLSLDDDGEYFSRVVAASERLRFVPKAKSYYRQHHPGSLSRSVSEEACKSLFLSLSLRIEQLLHIEDTYRTRAASLQLLNTWLEYFYPEKEELLSKAYSLAWDLGGVLQPPQLSWKYQPIRMVFGWKATKRVKHIVSNAKLLARVQRERLSG